MIFDELNKFDLGYNGFTDFELDNTMLIVHFEKDKPSRFGFAVRPCQVEVVVSWQDYYN